MAKSEPPVVHTNLALLHCESPAVLQETLMVLDLSGIPHQEFASRTLLIPEDQLSGVLQALHEAGVFPAVSGATHEPLRELGEEEE